ncbi:MAG: two-component system response regulator [Smithellaceae bacterium]|jgi:putative two-component system response regulator|nr:two-component system response regulator [Smithellaceae bacterium]HCX01198.1 two-component system response regulator [Syntrophaceae bacterium]
MEKKPHILVVDDEDRNLRLMEAVLLPLGYDVAFARNGEEALAKVRETPVDVILLDVMMPGLDGFEVARILKSDDRTKIIPVVMVTALQEVEDRIRALEAGADDFLAKPVDKTEIRARVASLVKVKAYNDYIRNYSRELETEVARRTRDLRLAFERIKAMSLEALYRLTRAAEYKDEDTGAHIQRMSQYSATIARTMGLNDQTVEYILYAAPMHDIGKIGIPDKILLKPGKLTEEEWVIMKEHTIIGGRILEGSKAGYIHLGEIVALTHHEKWDGSGYPLGLKGNKIPLVGRIVAIADVFDALMSKRPYKEAFPLEKSHGIIREGRGNHFDPAVVDAFFASGKELDRIRQEFKDNHDSHLFEMNRRIS